MARQAREKSSTGIYHIMVRGINQGNIFNEKEDKDKYIEILESIKEKTSIKIYGYSLMDNHLHLLIHEGQEEIGATMKRLGVSYVYWYNKKYHRKGHLFQDRFKSQGVENDEYLLSVLRYIHQNPVKSKLVSSIEEYPWSSYNMYIKNNKYNIVDTKDILGYFGEKSRDKQIRAYKKYMIENIEEGYLEESHRPEITDEELRKEIELLLKGQKINELSIEELNQMIKKIRKIEGASIRQIAKVTGINRNRVALIR